MKNFFKKIAMIGIIVPVCAFTFTLGGVGALAATGIDVQAIIQQVIDGAKGEMDKAVADHSDSGRSQFENQVVEEMTTASSALESKLDSLENSMNISDQEILDQATNEIAMLGEDVSVAVNSYYTDKIQEYRTDLTNYIADFIDQKQQYYGLGGDDSQ